MKLSADHATEEAPPTRRPQADGPRVRLRDVLRHNRQSGKGGVYAVCSVQPQVIDAAIHQSIAKGSVLHVESTSSQVNQFGGYTGQTPSQFAFYIRSAAQNAGLDPGNIVLGGDHLGPYPWRHEAVNSALEKAAELVRACVRSGYTKIHLDASMPCGDDGNGKLPEKTVAERAAILCEVAENAYRELPAGFPKPVYVIGSEVPTPGGEAGEAQAPVVTAGEHVHQTLETFQRAFAKRNVASAWERVIALVVQPGVDFEADAVFDYDRTKTRALSAALSSHPTIVYEAHSTDYQSPAALRQMVEDHFAILKVGPWLTFAFREALFALTAIERELLDAGSGGQASQIRDALEEAMMRNPTHWTAYYHGDEDQVRRDLTYGYSDRCRYYWNESTVQEEIARLFDNLKALQIPLTLVSQYLPLEYEAIRNGWLRCHPQEMVLHHIRQVMNVYAAACEA